MQRREVLRAAVGGAAVALAPALVRAQAWPSKPLRMVVPFIPGSAPDVIARMLAERLGPALGQALVIDNKPGAGGNIGLEVIAKAAPDGYTIGLGTSSQSINPSLYRKVGYDPLTDFSMINLTTAMPHVLVVPGDSPVKNATDLIRMLKASPGKFNYASGGNGSGAHLSAELFKAMAGVDAVHVPYKGAPEVITAVISNAVAFGFPTLSTAVPQIKGGRLRALAVTGPKRNHALPEVPTVGDTVAGYEVVSWFGLVAPARIPPEAVRRIDAETQRALQDPAFRDKVQADGTEVVNLGSAEFTAYYRNDLAKWKRVVELSGARVD
jgi:tripartite-type tricarboxylate transporter receptor subunit TctC